MASLMLHVRTEIQKGISLSAMSARARTLIHTSTRAHTHTLCGSSAGHGVEGRLAAADHGPCFHSFSARAFASGRLRWEAQATPGM